jgi:hypothetical protein
VIFGEEIKEKTEDHKEEGFKGSRKMVMKKEEGFIYVII